MIIDFGIVAEICVWLQYLCVARYVSYHYLVIHNYHYEIEILKNYVYYSFFPCTINICQRAIN